MLSGIKFAKMHGTGNDFVVIDLFDQNLPDDFNFSRAAQDFCARHFGIGSDGLLSLEPSQIEGCTVRMRMWNPDGSEDMCGNGLRCIARLAHLRGYVGNEFKVQALAGMRHVQIEKSTIRVGMGEPIFDAPLIPIRADLINGSPLDYTIPTSFGDLRCSTLSTGTTHTIIWLDGELSDEMFFTLSPQLEVSELFPERTSVMWARIQIPGEIAIRIWERGAGETLACGTGACATAVAALTTKRIQTLKNEARIESKGGYVRVAWRRNEGIQLSGEAQVVFEGMT